MKRRDQGPQNRAASKIPQQGHQGAPSEHWAASGEQTTTRSPARPTEASGLPKFPERQSCPTP